MSQIVGESFVRSPITRSVHQSGCRSLPLDQTGQEAQPRSSLLRFFHVLDILHCNQRSPRAFEGAGILPMINENPRSCNPHNSIGTQSTLTWSKQFNRQVRKYARHGLLRAMPYLSSLCARFAFSTTAAAAAAVSGFPIFAESFESADTTKMSCMDQNIKVYSPYLSHWWEDTVPE